MNKYQEALDNLWDWFMKNYDGKLNYDKYDLPVIVDKLVAKATPTKPNNDRCSYCGDVVTTLDNYCSNCGQSIDWSEEYYWKYDK